MNLIQTRRLTQEMADTYQRALTGGPFYAAAWLLVGIYGDAFSRAPLASWGLLLGLHRPVGLAFHASPDPRRRRGDRRALAAPALGHRAVHDRLVGRFVLLGDARLRLRRCAHHRAAVHARPGHCDRARLQHAAWFRVRRHRPAVPARPVPAVEQSRRPRQRADDGDVPGLRGHLAAAQLCRVPAAPGPGPGTAQPARPVLAAKPDRCTDRAGQPPPVRRRAGQHDAAGQTQRGAADAVAAGRRPFQARSTTPMATRSAMPA